MFNTVQTQMLVLMICLKQKVMTIHPEHRVGRNVIA